MQPPPGLLPLDRTDGTRPFQTIGVDFAGPIKYLNPSKNEVLYCAVHMQFHTVALPRNPRILTEFLDTGCQEGKTKQSVFG